MESRKNRVWRKMRRNNNTKKKGNGAVNKPKLEISFKEFDDIITKMAHDSLERDQQYFRGRSLN